MITVIAMLCAIFLGVHTVMQPTLHHFLFLALSLALVPVMTYLETYRAKSK